MNNVMQGEQSKAVKIWNMSGIINMFYDLISQILILDAGQDTVYLLCCSTLKNFITVAKHLILCYVKNLISKANILISWLK